MRNGIRRDDPQPAMSKARTMVHRGQELTEMDQSMLTDNILKTWLVTEEGL